MPYTIAPNPGTISVAAGSTDIVGSGTAFTTLRKGAIIYVPGIWGGQLASDPADDTHATLVLPIVPAGGDDVAGAAYGAIPLSDAIVYSERVRQLIELLSSGVVEQIAALSLIPGKVLGVDEGGGLVMLDPPRVAGVPFVFDGASTTESTGPVAGRIRFNSATAPTIAWISKTDADGLDVSTLLAGLDDSNNTVRSVVGLNPSDGANAFADIGVTGAITDNTTYVTVPVTLRAGAAPADGAALAMTAQPSGMDGATVTLQAGTGINVDNTDPTNPAISVKALLSAIAGLSGAAGAFIRATGASTAVMQAIVGTVSQSGGVPTGAIVEHGSNANGQYARWADGTQICWSSEAKTLATSTAYGSLFVSDPSDSNMPATFAAVPTFAMSADFGATGGGFRWPAVSVPGTVSAWPRRYFVEGITRASATLNLHTVAIGRWY